MSAGGEGGGHGAGRTGPEPSVPEPHSHPRAQGRKGEGRAGQGRVQAPRGPSCSQATPPPAQTRKPRGVQAQRRRQRPRPGPRPQSPGSGRTSLAPGLHHHPPPHGVEGVGDHARHGRHGLRDHPAHHDVRVPGVGEHACGAAGGVRPGAAAAAPLRLHGGPLQPATPGVRPRSNAAPGDRDGACHLQHDSPQGPRASGSGLLRIRSAAVLPAGPGPDLHGLRSRVSHASLT